MPTHLTYARAVARLALVTLVAGLLLTLPAAAQAAMDVVDLDVAVRGSNATVTWTSTSTGSSEVSVARDSVTAFNAAGTIQSAILAGDLGTTHSRTFLDLEPGEYHATARTAGPDGVDTSTPMRFVISSPGGASVTSSIVTDGAVTAMHTAGDDTWIAGSFRHVGPHTGGVVGLQPGSGSREAALPPVDGTINVVVPDGAGGAYIGGAFTSVGALPRNNIAHLLPDGGVDPGFGEGPGPNGEVWDIAMADGKLYVGGAFTMYAGASRNRLAVVDDSTGYVVTGTTPGTGFDGVVRAVEVIGGDLWVGGSFSSYQGAAHGRLVVLTRLDLADRNLTTDVTGVQVNDLMALPSGPGQVLVGGAFSGYNGVGRPNVVVLGATGALHANSPIAGATGAVNAFASTATTVYAAGAFDTFGTTAANGIVALSGTTAAPEPWTLASPFDAGAVVRDIDVTGTTIHAVGTFTMGGPVSSPRTVAAMTLGGTSSWSLAGTEQGRETRAVAVSGGRVLVGGNFRMFGATPRNGLAKVNTTTGAVDQDFVVGTGVTGRTATIHAMQSMPGATGQAVLYVAGDFSGYDSTTGLGNLVRIFAETGTAPSGSVDPTFAASGGANNMIHALASPPAGRGILIGGEFVTWRGAPANRIAHIDESGSLDTTFDPPDPDGNVSSLARVGNRVFAGGHFTKVGSLIQNGVASFAFPTGAADTDFVRYGPASEFAGAPNNVSELLPAADGNSLFIAGEFDKVQGIVVNRIARIDVETGDVDPTFRQGAGAGFDAKVTALALAGNRLYVGGPFATFNGVYQPRLVAVDATTGVLDRTYRPAVVGQVDAISASVDQTYIGGSITTINGLERPNAGLLRRTRDTTPPVGRVYEITDPTSGASTDGVVVKNVRHVVVNPTTANASFTMTFLAHDRAVSSATLPGSASGLDRIEWPTLPAARGAWDPGAAVTPGAPAGLHLDCWDAVTPGAASANPAIDEAIDWFDWKRPDVTPSLPAILAKLGTQPTPADGIDRDQMSCRWTGYLSVPDTTNVSYAFRGRSDGGMRAQVQHLGSHAAPWETIEDWSTPGVESAPSAPIAFGPTGARPVTVEWYSDAGDGIAALEWDPPGADTWRAVPAEAYATEVYYTRQFTLADGAGATTGRSTIDVASVDKAGNVTTETFDLSTDVSPPAAPTSFTTSPGVGSHQSDAITVTITAPGIDVGDAGVESHVLQRRSLPFAGTDSTTCAGAIDEAGWQSIATWSTQSTWVVNDADLPDGCHQYRLVSRDNVGNVAKRLATGIGNESTDWIRVDTTAPAAVTNVVDGDAADIDLVVTSTIAKAHWTAAVGTTDTVRYEACVSTVAGCTGSVARSWINVGMATSLDWSGLSLNDGATYVVSVRPGDAAGNLGVPAASDGFLVDVTPATASSPTSPARGTLTLGGSLNGLLSTLGVLELTATNGTDTIEPCIPVVSGTTWNCSWDTNDVLDGSWQVQLVALDLLGGGLTIPVGSSIDVDNSGPVASSLAITSATNPGASHVAGAGVVWINTADAGSFQVRVPATDPHGVSYTFPGFGSGWTPASSAVGSLDTVEYAWLTSVVQPSDGTPLNATVTLTDGVGNTSTTGFSVRADTTAPGTGTIDQHPGVTSVPQVDVTPGTDTGSGVDLFRVERESAPLLDRNTCDTGAWRADWTTISDDGSLVVTDTSVDPGTCYRYRLVTTDHVGNVRTDVASGAVVTDQHAIVPTPLADITEGSLPGSYSIRLHRAPSTDVTLDLTSDADQVSLDHAQLVFTPTNYATPQVVFVTAIDDSIDEDDQHTTLITHTVTTTDPDYGGHAPIVIAATIHDVNTAGVRVTAPAYLDIEEAGGVGETYTVALATRPTHPVTITIPGNDQVTTAPTHVEFTPLDWSVPRVVTVTAIDDALVEGRHTTSVHATAASTDPKYDDVAIPDAAVRISDDDEADIDVDVPASTLLAEGDGNRVVTYRVRLTAQPRHSVTITATDLLGQVDLQPASITIDPTNWRAWHDIMVRARQDEVAEPNPHVSRVSLTASSLDQAFDSLAPTQYEQEVVEDDVAAYVTALGTTWGRSSTGTMQVAENAASGATMTFAPRTAPTSEITIRPAVSRETRVGVTPASATIPAGSMQPITFAVQPVDDTLDQADLDVTITWNTSTSDAMYAAVRLDDTAFSVTDDDTPAVDRTVRDVATPPVETTRPDPKEPTPDRTPTPDERTPDATNPSPAAEPPTPSVGTPTPDAPPIDEAAPAPNDASPVEPDTNLDEPAATPRNVAPRRNAERRSRAARVKDWAREHKGAAASAGVATVAIAGAAAKAVAGKGLLGLFKSVPGLENVLDHARHLRPRRFKKDAERLKKLRRHTRSHEVRNVHRRRRRRREGEDPMRDIFDRLDGDYVGDGPDILDRIEGNVPVDRIDILDASELPDAGFELDLDDYDARAA